VTFRAALFSLALVFAGCATAPPSAPLPSLTSVPKSFEMSARLSVRQGDRSDIARLRWTRRPGSDLWVFSSPIGNEVARIESSASGATLERAGAGREEAPSFAALTERLLGIALDPAELSAWLHGQPGRQGTPAEWTVTVDERQAAGAIEMARRVTATRGDVVLKLVVDQYRPLGE
jgi:outer membrane biogenesis lipoprotein LolB